MQRTTLNRKRVLEVCGREVRGKVGRGGEQKGRGGEGVTAYEVRQITTDASLIRKGQCQKADKVQTGNYTYIFSYIYSYHLLSLFNCLRLDL